jgi:hypothetical protein
MVMLCILDCLLIKSLIYLKKKNFDRDAKRGFLFRIDPNSSSKSIKMKI